MTTHRRFLALAALATGLTGCQQKMAEQPAPRPYDVASQGVFAFDQSARPLQPGTVFRGQRSADDPMLAWLTPQGKAPKVNPDWKKAVDPNGEVVPTAGTPTDVGNFVNEFPFEMTETELKRGQQRFNVFCAECHGAAGNGWGKIVERGFLRPPSYHQDPQDKAFDWSTTGQPSTELKQGFSRGFFRYGVKVPLDQVPVGYIYQVITWGFGGMPEHASQIPPEDRWRITAYIRALQLSQGADVTTLPVDAKKLLESGGKSKAETKKDDKGHH
ncbi:c-type cytochrome [Limnoglobus roseus]|uniref:Cytochrome c n=1 Tax=Limnoglobus roseus TaxID=2598579 RepID=A0A5C1ABH0_9BACT|nr:cytochrome c [Limnoglobus roseus]QEL15366.1 cytochrome c [Limnoglobus roseus]